MSHSHELLKQYQEGRSEAATAIFDRYVERLLALARSRIGSRLKRRIDPEDVVQSAYQSFFVHARNREYQLARSGDLWRLLASTTLNKLYGQIEKQTAAKRTVDRETGDDRALADLGTPEPTVAEVVAVGEQLKLIIDGLSRDERVVLMSTLQGQSIAEISRVIDRSERTVRRLLAQARVQFEERLLGAGAPRRAGAADVRPRARPPEAPLKFSDYLLRELLGSGGMGKVYRATDRRSGKTVAVKALHKARQSDQRAVDQFVQEAQILGKLQHDNIVGVQGLGQFPAGGYFIVMDFVDGSDLERRLADGPLPVSEVVAIAKQVARAVQYAHNNGVVHCDLKPANVLLDNEQRVFVTDFGFAFRLTGGATQTGAGVGGTEGYIAPEVLRAQSRPTRAADIYGLGVMLWTLATGKRPGRCGTVRAEHPTLAQLDAICRRCTADDPDRRYRDVAELIRALGDLEAG